MLPTQKLMVYAGKIIYFFEGSKRRVPSNQFPFSIHPVKLLLLFLKTEWLLQGGNCPSNQPQQHLAASTGCSAPIPSLVMAAPRQHFSSLPRTDSQTVFKSPLILGPFVDDSLWSYSLWSFWSSKLSKCCSRKMILDVSN